jgi:hypothetical protein
MATAQIDFLLAGVMDGGAPLASGKVYTYAAGTTTAKTCWTDKDKTAEATNPIVLDADGRAEVYADGVYKLVIKTSADVTVDTFDGVKYPSDPGIITTNITVNETASGYEFEYAVGETVAFGEILYFNGTDGEYKLADADASTTMPAVVIALEAGDDGDTIDLLHEGFVRDDSWTWTPGGILYASTTPGAMTHTAPSGSGDQVQALGYALTAKKIYFKPNLVLVEVV